jgi:hypothetical protein
MLIVTVFGAVVVAFGRRVWAEHVAKKATS